MPSTIVPPGAEGAPRLSVGSTESIGSTGSIGSIERLRLQTRRSPGRGRNCIATRALPVRRSGFSGFAARALMDGARCLAHHGSMTNGKVNVAVVGLGFGAEFIPIYQRHPGANLVAICQRTNAKLDEIGDRFAIAKRYTQFADVLADPDIDA